MINPERTRGGSAEPKTAEFQRSDFSLEVVSVTREVFRQWLGIYPQRWKIEWYDWIEINDNIPIENSGACSCAIIYTFCPSENKILSGHFRLNSGWKSQEEIINYKKNTDGKISIPTASDIRLASPPHWEEYQRYYAMLKRIKELVGLHGSQMIKMYLFGQNFYGQKPDAVGSFDVIDLEKIGDTYQDRIDIVADFIRQGVSLGHIADLRTYTLYPVYGGADDTLYVPQERTIYHCHR